MDKDNNNGKSSFASLMAKFETKTTKQVKKEKPKIKFIAHTTGKCHVELAIMGSSDIVELMWVYDQEGQKVGVSKENLKSAIEEFKFTIKKPKHVKMHGSAPPVHWTDGLTQIFACFNCSGKMFPDDGCDTVTHADGCKRINYIAGGDGHSTKNVKFRYAVSKLTKTASLKEIMRVLESEPEASAFWGLFDMIKLFKTAPKTWLKELAKAENGLGVHESLQNLVASLKNLLEE